jgi:tubulin polyglutamylase TTLL6/13
MYFSAVEAASCLPRHLSKPHMHLKVAQRYITNPMLLLGRKFHLRLWLLVTDHCPLRAYLHERGLVLFSSEPYQADEPLAGEKSWEGQQVGGAANKHALYPVG